MTNRMRMVSGDRGERDPLTDEDAGNDYVFQVMFRVVLDRNKPDPSAQGY